jgi:hypothetical protein
MRLVRGALAAGCFLAGLWLMLRALGLLGVALQGVARWWPALLVVAGAAIIARSVRPGPHTALAGGLICVGCIAFATTRGVMTGRPWTFVAAAGLMATGVISAWINVSARPDRSASPFPRIVVLFRTASFTPRSSELEWVRIFLLCGRLDLNLTEAVHPGHDRDAIRIDITACAGNVHMQVLPGVGVVDHKAFVMRLRRQIQAGVLDEGQSDTADVVVGTLAFFGDAQVPPQNVIAVAGGPVSGGQGS